MKNSSFFGIGMQKAGTTWLYSCLEKHREIKLPIIKEVHFFDEIGVYKSNFSRLTSNDWRGKRVRRLFLKAIYNILLFKSPKKWWHAIEMLMLPRRINALTKYKRLLDKGNYSGEITPAYSTLDANLVGSMHEVFPDKKIIVILRNPVERDWSHFKMSFLNEQVKEKSTVESPFNSFLKANNLRGDLAKTINTWRTHYPNNQLFIGFYDKLKTKPLEFLNEIAAFLEITPFEEVPVKERVNKGKTISFDLPFEFALYKKHEEQLQQLNKLFKGEKENYCQDWIDRMNQVYAMMGKET